MRVAALDGFALVVTKEMYQTPRDGLWAQCLRDGVPFHLYDGWISCRAAELGYETWMLPIECHHEGGATSVKMQVEYEEVVRRLGYRDSQHLYDEGHKRVYERFAQLLPLRIHR